MRVEHVDVERNPGGSGLVVSVRFTPDEADLVLRRAEFDEPDQGVTVWLKNLALDAANQRSWTRLLHYGP